MKEPKTAFIARGLSKNGVRSFIETEFEKENKKKRSNLIVFTDEKDYQARFPNLEVVYIKATNKLVWDYLVLPFYLKKYKVEEAIYTKNIVPFTHVFGNWKKISYVLDLAFKYPELKAYKKFDALYMNLFLGLSLRISDEIWPISEFTKNEICNFFPFTKNKKIIVKDLMISNIFKKVKDRKEISKIKKKYQLNDKFIFYCGSISPRKNILNLLKAFNEVKDNFDHDLYLVSSRSWNSDDVLDYLDKNLKDRARIIQGITDEELVSFYSIADLFVYPSLYEGYGLPIKEAEACGCKVLTSNFGSMKEVAGKKTFRVDTKNVNKLSESILEIVK